MRSVEEVNAISTSFSPSSPTFAGSSTSDPFIGGTYSGENGDTTLTFEATLGGIVGTTPIQIEVRDDQDTLVDTIDTGFSAAGTTFTLVNGLELSFTSGSIALGDSFELEVFESIGSAVRIDNSFAELGDDGAGFEDGFAVVDGAFDINSVSIAVNANDSLNDVLTRITASAAGVTATFDEASETVILTQNTNGSASDIVLANDTSGLLAATKLDTATSVLGTLDESAELISEVSELSGIQSGTFSVNGVSISIDILQDSLSDIIDRINNSSADVQASFDGSTGKFTIQASGTDPLVLDNETSNFFTGLAISEGTFDGKSTSSRTKFRNEVAFRRGLSEFAKAFSDVFDGSFSGFGAASIAGIRSKLEGIVADTFDDVLGKSGSGTLSSGLGINLASGDTSYRMLVVDSSKVGRALKQDADKLAEFLFAEEKDGGTDGLLTALGAKFGELFGTIESLLGPDAVGLNLDISG